MINSVPKWTLNPKGQLRAYVAHDGRDKERVTVVLAFSSLGHLLPRMYIFKGNPESNQSWSKLDNIYFAFGSKVLLALTPSGFATMSTSMQYLSAVVARYTRGHNLKHTIVGWDAFSGHGMNNRTKTQNLDMYQHAQALGLDLAYIPGGVSAYGNVGDSHFHRTFKHGIAMKYAEHRLRLAEEFLSGNTNAATTPDFSMSESEARLWIVQACEEVLSGPEFSQDKIQKAFLENGLVNDLFGSQEEQIRVVHQIYNKRH